MSASTARSHSCLGPGTSASTAHGHSCLGPLSANPFLWRSSRDATDRGSLGLWQGRPCLLPPCPHLDDGLFQILMAEDPQTCPGISQLTQQPAVPGKRSSEPLIL